MKKSIIQNLFIGFVLLFTPSLGGGWGEVLAQPEQPAPKWTAKACKAIVSVLTYDRNNELLHSGTGAFITPDGVGVSDYSVWRDAYSGAVVDQDGHRYEVERILGADDTYGVVRFRVSDAKKVSTLSAATSSAAAQGRSVLALTYGKSAPVSCPQAVIEKKDVVEDGFAYLTLSTAFPDKFTGAMLFTVEGDFVGIVQSPIAGKSYATDSRHATAIEVEALPKRTDAVALQNIHLRKGLPSAQEEALVYLYFQSRSADNDTYIDLLDLFVSTWPDCAEGYLRRATPLMDLQRFGEADRDLQTYLRLAADKGQAEANVANAIFSKLTYQHDVAYEPWTYDLALEHIEKALAENDRQMAAAATDSLRRAVGQTRCGYQLQKAQILMAKPDTEAAVALYEQLASGPYRSPALLYAEAMARQQRGDSASVLIALLDSAVAMFPEPIPEEAATYIMRRGQLKALQGRYREAVLDYNQYCYLKNNKVSAVFYYERSQLEVQGRMYQQALDDLDQAIERAPREALYYVEKSALLLRVNELNSCIENAMLALRIDPDLSDAYRILGYALILKGDKAGGRKNLEKAVALGDESAQELIDKYAN
ncbi:MAG: hypothetical protein IKG96_06805 [Bacteroidaceae bacterium]|nr:hypothetical protein [Bacteroidaceae bacterium]